MAIPPVSASGNQPQALPSSAMPFISPPAFLHAHLRQQPSTRPTKRSLGESRPIHLNVSSLTHANGSALVRIGDTTVVCGVRAEILPVKDIANYRVYNSSTATSVQPEGVDSLGDYSQITKYNLLVPNLDLTSGCSPLFPPNTSPPLIQQSLTLRLASLLHSTQLVPSSDLQIRYTQPAELFQEDSLSNPASEIRAFWTLYIDILCLAHSGISTTFDAAWLAILAALRDTVLPKAAWDPDIESVICSDDNREVSRLNLMGCPVPLSWAVFVPEKRLRNSHIGGNFSRRTEDAEKYVLVDPDGFEEDCCEEIGTITVEISRGSLKIVRLEKAGGMGIGVSEMKQLVRAAQKRHDEWRSLLDESTHGRSSD